MTINKRKLKKLSASYKAYKSAVESVEFISAKKKEKIKNHFFMIESKSSVEIENKACRTCV